MKLGLKKRKKKQKREGKRKSGGSKRGGKKNTNCGDCICREIGKKYKSVSSKIKHDRLPVMNHHYVFLAEDHSVIPDYRGGNHRRVLSVAQTFMFMFTKDKEPLLRPPPPENHSFNLWICSAVTALVMILIEIAFSWPP